MGRAGPGEGRKKMEKVGKAPPPRRPPLARLPKSLRMWLPRSRVGAGPVAEASPLVQKKAFVPLLKGGTDLSMPQTRRPGKMGQWANSPLEL